MDLGPALPLCADLEVSILEYAATSAGAYYVCRRWRRVLRSVGDEDEAYDRFVSASLRLAFIEGNWACYWTTLAELGKKTLRDYCEGLYDYYEQPRRLAHMLLASTPFEDIPCRYLPSGARDFHNGLVLGWPMKLLEAPVATLDLEEPFMLCSEPAVCIASPEEPASETEAPFVRRGLLAETPAEESLTEAIAQSEGWGHYIAFPSYMFEVSSLWLQERSDALEKWKGRRGVSIEDAEDAFQANDMHELLKNAMATSFLDEDDYEEPFLVRRPAPE